MHPVDPRAMASSWQCQTGARRYTTLVVGCKGVGFALTNNINFLANGDGGSLSWSRVSALAGVCHSTSFANWRNNEHPYLIAHRSVTQCTGESVEAQCLIATFELRHMTT